MMGTMAQLQARQGEKWDRFKKGDKGGYKWGREADERGQREQIRRWEVSLGGGGAWKIEKEEEEGEKLRRDVLINLELVKQRL